MSVDLHVHSTASDGTLTPGEVAQQAAAAGLSAVALTDHDTFAGLPQALETALTLDLSLIPAVEVSAQDGPQELHVLGFFVDPCCGALREALQRVRSAREDRMRKIVEKLRSLGVAISMQDVRAVAGDAALGRPHAAAALLRVGEVNSSQEAFTRYLRRGRPAYVDRYRLPAGEALEVIAQARGVSVLAHPGLGCPDAIIYKLREAGLQGLEAYHIDHRPRQTRHYLELAEQLGLMVTGGSDSHGPDGPTPVAVGAVDVPDQLARDLIGWGEEHGRWPPDPDAYNIENCTEADLQ